MRAASTVVAGLLLAVLAVGAYLRNDEESAATGAGAAVGTLLVGLLVAALIRFVHVRWIRKQGELSSHWLLWIAAIVILISLAGQAARDSEENARDPTGLARFQDRERAACAGDTDFDLPPIEGMTTRPATPEEVGTAATAATGLKLYAVEEKGEPIAFVTAAIVSADQAEEFLSGMNGSVRKGGGKEQRAATIDGVEVSVFQLSDQAVMTFHRGCHAVFVRGGDRATARFVVEPVVRSLR